MKNIIILNREIHSKDSIPQVMIHFEKQTDNALIFVVLIVYAHSEFIEKMIGHNLSGIDVVLERKDIVGFLEGEHPKIAQVYRFKLFKSKDLLRNDFSVNINLARKKVYAAICQSIGEVRDYDGGLILKQQELFSELEECFSKELKENRELLENFFYSITPIEKQATLSLASLKKLFALVLASFKEDYTEKGSYTFNLQREERYLAVFIRAEDASLKSALLLHMESFSMRKIVYTFFSIQETVGIGFIIESPDQEFQNEFIGTLQSILSDWRENGIEKRVLRLNLDEQALTLDPRLLKDVVSKEILQMLFEGLMRIGSKGNPECAVAESVEISPCLKTYLFHLRDCKWSNGTPVDAFNFEYAWKKILSPQFVTPYVHYLFHIKNANAAKNLKKPIKEIGVRALNSKTLRVDLEYPLPYFLELLTLPIFFPVNHHIDQIHPHWPSFEGDAYLCNGPFRLKKNRPGDTYVFEKNPFYWDAHQVYLHQIILSSFNSRLALEMYKREELDWLGYPVCNWNPIYEFANSGSDSH